MPDIITPLNEWSILLAKCSGENIKIKLAAPESLSAQDVLVKLGAALDYPLEVLAERSFGTLKELDIVFTEVVPIELFQRTCYKIESREAGCGWSSFNAVGDLRFATEAEAEAKRDEMSRLGWRRKDLRVVNA